MFTLNFYMLKKNKIYLAHVSEQNSGREKQIILLIILNKKG